MALGEVSRRRFGAPSENKISRRYIGSDSPVKCASLSALMLKRAHLSPMWIRYVSS
jgi:hypothetical protein